jgi:hypothetical protein
VDPLLHHHPTLTPFCSRLIDRYSKNDFSGFPPDRIFASWMGQLLEDRKLYLKRYA